MAAKLLKRGKFPYIQFPDRDGRRRTISLGDVSDKTAKAIFFHVNRLAESVAFNDTLPRETAEWLEGVPAPLHKKLVDVGLAKARTERRSVEIGAFCQAYIDGRTDVAQNTRNILGQTKKFLVAFFTAKRDLTTINRGEAGDWHRAIARELSVATVIAYLRRARQMFNDARHRKLITENPFDGIKPNGSQVNDARQKFVAAADVLKAMDQCPEAEWRLIFALARWGGLRVPSETTQLRWTDVDFGAGRMTVRSPKTEHQGKPSRVVPIFPELMPWLREAFEAADDGTAHVTPTHRGDNLRTTALKFIERAGVTPWPRLFQNMRSSRQTELEDEFPTHVVCAWLGNSPKVARKHYLQTTDAHFDKAKGFRAAPGAALRPAMEAPVAHQNGDNAPLNAENGGNQCPRWESKEGPFSKGIAGVKGAALRRALRRVRNASPAQYAALTAPHRRRLSPSPAARTGVSR